MVERSGNRVRQRGVQLKMRAALPGTSISVVSEPRAVATGSCAQLSIDSYFVNYFLIRSLPLAVLTRFVATITFNYTLLKETTGIQFEIFILQFSIFNIRFYPRLYPSSPCWLRSS